MVILEVLSSERLPESTLSIKLFDLKVIKSIVNINKLLTRFNASSYRH